MKRSLYPRLALDGIRKNRQLYYPFILTCICMVSMHYILTFLAVSPRVAAFRGGDTLCAILFLGVGVVSVFSLVFLFYTHSFLIRRRRKEFGLYNVLGMDKKNLTGIITWETLIFSGMSLVLGLLLGVILSKLFEMGLARLLKETVDYRITFLPKAFLITASSFAAIFLLIWLSGVTKVRKLNAIALLKSESAGEKPPKKNRILGLSGVFILGLAYYLAVCCENAMAAILYFFVAVLLVIIATYLLMISGSVLLCRVLQSDKRYYYNPRHFVSVSSMAFRMKRNGAGLASICIIATMVLVMVSTTASMYIGTEDSLSTRYPREINLTFRMANDAQLSEEYWAPFAASVDDTCKEFSAQASNIRSFCFEEISGLLQEDRVVCDYSRNADRYKAAQAIGELRDFYFFSAEEYSRLTGETVSLGEGEAILFTEKPYAFSDISFENGLSFSLTDIRSGYIYSQTADDSIDTMTLIVPSLSGVTRALYPITYSENEHSLTFSRIYRFDTGLDDQGQIALANALEAKISRLELPQDNLYRFYHLETRAGNADDFYASNGSIFFLGITLSIVFLAAAVLIIYYKQISEGFEDRARFGIMQKVGMTARDIRRSINSQLLTVFYLPLLMAALHLTFAFPMIRKILTLFSLNNVRLFAVVTIISFGVFALLYAIVYKITSNTYYSIVRAENVS